jgi:hypothetical protein
VWLHAVLPRFWCLSPRVQSNSRPFESLRARTQVARIQGREPARAGCCFNITHLICEAITARRVGINLFWRHTGFARPGLVPVPIDEFRLVLACGTPTQTLGGVGLTCSLRSFVSTRTTFQDIEIPSMIIPYVAVLSPSQFASVQPSRPWQTPGKCNSMWIFGNCLLWPRVRAQPTTTVVRSTR